MCCHINTHRALHYSPVLISVPFFDFAIPSLSYIFPGNAIRAILRVFPFSVLRFHRIMDISEVLSRRSREIVDEKKGALAKGDEELKLSVGEGKDIMSVLRKLTYIYGSAH